MNSTKKKSAVITGVYGQDGYLLARHLLAMNYRVAGLVSKIKPEFSGLEQVDIIAIDIVDPEAMRSTLLRLQPDEFYHLAAMHHSSEHETTPDFYSEMFRVNFLSTQTIIDVIVEFIPECRFLYAGSSQMFTAGDDVTVVDESTPYRPSTYYGITKVASAHLIDLLRRQRKLWGVTAILFNHESIRRRPEFLSRKVTLAAAKFSASGAGPKLELRDIGARVDWSAAGDIVQAMHLALQADAARDYVLASGMVHSVRELLDEAFGAVALDWSEYVDAPPLSSGGTRPCMQGNPALARDRLQWRAQTSFASLVQEMVANDLKEIRGQ